MTTALASFNVSKSIGPFFVAVVLDAFLYGVVSAQAFLYLVHFSNDRRRTQTLVGTIWAAETVQTCLNIVSAYHHLVTNFGNYSNLLVSTRESQMGPFITAIIAWLVQCFFAWRVKALTSKAWIAWFIVVCAFIQLLGGIGTTIAATKVPYIPDFPKFHSIVAVWCTGAVLADVTITGTLVLYLRGQKTGMAFTDTLINKITALTLETGLLTLVWTIVDLIVYVAVPSPSSAHLVFNLTVSKMYSLSLLVHLNARAGWQRDASTAGGAALHASDPPPRLSAHLARAPSSNASFSMNMFDDARAKQVSQPTRIFVDVASHQVVDSDVESRVSY